MDAFPEVQQPKQEPIPDWWFNCQCEPEKKCARCKQKAILIKYGMRDINGKELKKTN
jgi:hypothetical protein